MDNTSPSTTPSTTPESSAPSPQKSSMLTKKVLGFIGALALIGGVAEIATHRKEAPTPVPAATNNYKDGTYTAEGDYVTHVGPESIQITVTLSGNIITDTQFQSTPNAAMSGHFMDMFSQNYKQFVVGKNINDVHLTKVSGSSLTPMGFNDALTKIKAQAQA